ncbi:MAG: hypothetical protein HRF42_04720 [Candidatus Brocadia sp.]|jgi:vacuolar-type H+-ATPase subunit H
MPEIEELEHRITRLEALYEDVLKERITQIASRLDQIYEKIEHDKTEILTKTEKDRSEILAKIEKDKSEILTKAEKDKTEILIKTERDKREIIYWMVGLNLGFLTLTITALWAILSFALKR